MCYWFAKKRARSSTFGIYVIFITICLDYSGGRRFVCLGFHVIRSLLSFFGAASPRSLSAGTMLATRVSEQASFMKFSSTPYILCFKHIEQGLKKIENLRMDSRWKAERKN